MSWDKVRDTKTGNEFFKLKAGDNKVRVLTDPVRVMKYYNQAAKKSFIAFKDCGYSADTKPRWLCYVYNHEKEAIELAELPHTIAKQMLEYKDNDDYKFDSCPMPYDVTINKKGENLETEYNVIPARKNSDIPKETLDELKTLKPCGEIKKAWQEKELENLSKDEEWLNGYKKRVKARKSKTEDETIEYPEEDISPEDIPF